MNASVKIIENKNSNSQKDQDTSSIEEKYKRLNEYCDKVLEKIKTRKNKNG